MVTNRLKLREMIERTPDRVVSDLVSRLTGLPDDEPAHAKIAASLRSIPEADARDLLFDLERNFKVTSPLLAAAIAQRFLPHDALAADVLYFMSLSETNARAASELFQELRLAEVYERILKAKAKTLPLPPKGDHIYAEDSKPRENVAGLLRYMYRRLAGASKKFKVSVDERRHNKCMGKGCAGCGKRGWFLIRISEVS